MNRDEAARNARKAYDKKYSKEEQVEHAIKGGQIGGRKRMSKLSKKQRTELASKAAKTRWVNWKKLQDSKTSEFKQAIREKGK